MGKYFSTERYLNRVDSNRSFSGPGGNRGFGGFKGNRGSKGLSKKVKNIEANAEIFTKYRVSYGLPAHVIDTLIRYFNTISGPNGKISFKEFFFLFGLKNGIEGLENSAVAERAFVNADLDKDGSLNLDEFINFYFTQMRNAKLSDAYDSSSFDPFDLHFGSLINIEEGRHNRLVSEEEYEVPNEHLPEVLDGSIVEQEKDEYEFKRVPIKSKHTHK